MFGMACDVGAETAMELKDGQVEGLSLHFAALRCRGKEVPLQSSVPCKLCLPVSTFDVCIRIYYTSSRPFSAFHPRLLSAGGLQTQSPMFVQSAQGGGSIRSCHDGWLRLRFPPCLQSGRSGLEGTISIAAGGAWTNLPSVEAALPFELQCRFEDYVPDIPFEPEVRELLLGHLLRKGKILADTKPEDVASIIAEAFPDDPERESVLTDWARLAQRR